MKKKIIRGNKKASQTVSNDGMREVYKIVCPGGPTIRQLVEQGRDRVIAMLKMLRECVDDNIKGRFDVSKDCLNFLRIPDEVPDLVGNGTGILLDKADKNTKEIKDVFDRKFPEANVVIGHLEMNGRFHGIYKVSGIIDEYGDKRIVTHFRFCDFVDDTGFQKRLEWPYIDSQFLKKN